jgi:hypothetical protein
MESVVVLVIREVGMIEEAWKGEDVPYAEKKMIFIYF